MADSPRPYPFGHVHPDGSTVLEWADSAQKSAEVSRVLLEELIADQNALRKIKRILSDISASWELD